MKRTLLTACLLFGLTAAAKAPIHIVDEIDSLNISEEEKADFRAAYDDFYEAAETVTSLEAKYYGTEKKLKSGAKLRAAPGVKADFVDPTIRKIQEQARKYHNRFEVLNKTVHKWGPSTNLLARAARQSMQSRLDETRAERDQAEEEVKPLKEMQKAAKKFGKNLEKAIKDITKYRDKASTEEEAAFWQSLLDIIPVPNEDAK